MRSRPVARPAEIRNVTLVFKDGLGFDGPEADRMEEGDRRDSLTYSNPLTRRTP